MTAICFSLARFVPVPKDPAALNERGFLMFLSLFGQKRKFFAALAFLGLGWAAPLGAQTVGTTTADILKINDGVRPAGMGGAYTALGDDVYAINYNPAGLSYMKASQLVIFHLDSIADIQYEYLAFGTAWNGGNVLATNIIYRHMPSIDNQPGILPAVNSDDLLLSLAYARKITDNIRVGLTLKHLSSTLANYSATATAFDIGGLLDKIKNPFLPFISHTIGLSIQNLGPGMTFDPSASADPLPLFIRLGLGSHFVVDKEKDMNFGIELFKPSDQDFKMGLGAEFWLFPQLFAVRVGYKIENFGTPYGGTLAGGGQAPSIPNAFQNYTIGCILTRKFDDDDFSVDIAYDPANFTSTTEDTFFFGLNFKFNQLRLF